MCCDDKYNTENINLYNYNDIYFPDEGYYNANKFPKEWMEMFDPVKKLEIKLDDEKTDRKPGYEKYSP